MKSEPAFISNCCAASITQADTTGHGICSECGENCVPKVEYKIYYIVATKRGIVVTYFEKEIDAIKYVELRPYLTYSVFDANIPTDTNDDDLPF